MSKDSNTLHYAATSINGNILDSFAGVFTNRGETRNVSKEAFWMLYFHLVIDSRLYTDHVNLD